MYAESLLVVRDLPKPEGRWELVEVIGEGNYGQVYKARRVSSGETAAVKIMDAVVDKEEDIKSELNVFNNHSRHPNIVNFIGAFLNKDPTVDDQLWIVMEYCAAGSVTDLVKSMKEQGERLAEDVISFVLREVLAGVCYLHSSCIIHRDIKGQNVLLTSDAQVKLIDFGISAIVDGPSGRRRTAIGTPYWMAPEVIACETQYDYDYDARADVWSLGITAIEVADSTPPLFGENPMRALFKIPKNRPPTVQQPHLWSKQFNDFVAKCLVKDFEKRPTSHQLCTHEFVCFVPRKPKILRQKLKRTIDNYCHIQPTIFSDSSTSSHTSTSPLKKSFPLPTMKVVDDLATLEFIDENVIVAQLSKRYQKKNIYTSVGDILISVNPFQKLDIYDDEHSRRYSHSHHDSLPPHIFAIASRAYFSMVHTTHDQCCVVSGESGSGKTEASNILVHQFMKLGRAKTRSLEEKILKLNPLMESFGNARTVINSNSSRFGKFLELHFTSDGRVVGAHLSEYLLEKSRVVSQARKERNFHIFYYLLAGLGSRGQLGSYRLSAMHGQHRYLDQRGTAMKGHAHKSTRREALLADKFEEIERIFQLFGFSDQEFESVCCILAAVLNIGDIRLETNFHSHIGEVSFVQNSERVHDVAELLQIEADELLHVLTMTPVVTHGETIERHNTIVQAMDARDAIAKALYGRLFSWIVNRINPALHPVSTETAHMLSIGILDIFGFENFRSNSFEQLCINVANEQLQFYFNQHVFAWEQEEYEREGIFASTISYSDNRPLLDMLISRPMGLLPLLDEESKFPQASDLSLAAKLHEHFKSNPHYKMPKDRGPTFSIVHYAGLVTYETAGFLEKNRDTLKPNASKLLESSTNAVVSALYHTPLSRTGSLSSTSSLSRLSAAKSPAPSATPLFNRRAPVIGQTKHAPSGGSKVVSGRGRTPLSYSGTLTSAKQQTVSNYFVNSLRELVSKMLIAKPHFVRCIRPNELRSPLQFRADKVLMQLRHTGVVETTRIRKEGFSHRILFSDFIERYKVISFQLSQRIQGTPTNCENILKRADLQDWAMGFTKVFLKYYHVDHLDKLLSKFERSAVILQCLIRGWQARRVVARLKEHQRRNQAATLIQAIVRGWLSRVHMRRLKRERMRAAVVIQAVVRGWLSRIHLRRLRRERTNAAVVIQAVVRGWLSRVHLRKLRRERTNAAVVIQAAVRCWLAKSRYAALLTKRRKIATKIQSVVRMYLACRRVKAIQDQRKAEMQKAFDSLLSRSLQQQSLPSQPVALSKGKSLSDDPGSERVFSGDKAISDEQSPGLREQKDLLQPQLAERKTLSPQELPHREHNEHPQTDIRDRQRPSSDPLLQETPLGLNSSNTRAGSPVPRLSQKLLWRPCVMTYYEGMEERPHAQTPKIPPTAGRITQSARKFFEELIAQQSGKPVSQQRVRGKRKKPKKDSVFHRLLERFDHLKA